MESLLAAPQPILVLLVFALGLIWGSFFNVLIYRLPIERSPWRGRSVCPQCAHTISWKDNIPLLSFVWLKGKCRACRQPISWRYPTVELFTGVLFVALFLYQGLGFAWLRNVVFLSLLLVISFIDLKHRIIPDELSLGGLVLGFCFSVFSVDPTWLDSLLGIVLGGSSFLLVAWVYEKISKQEGLGGGDVKLLAMIGAWLGYQSVLTVILISSALGSLVGVLILVSGKGGLKSAIPFGPFLALAAAICALWGNFFYRWMYASAV